MKNILCIGAGHVGGPTMAFIAKKCPDYKVHLVDINEERIRAWQQGKPPMFEPGLEDLLAETRTRNLSFSTDIPKGIREADIIFVSVNTPIKASGVGAGRAADLQYYERTARQIRDCSVSDKIVVEKSTIPVRTAEAMLRILNSENNGVHFEVVSNPEFLAEGTALCNLETPDRVLIGGDSTDSGRKAVEEIVNIYARWVPLERIVTTNVWSSELSKLASNAFLAQRVSSINAISAIAEVTGADVEDVGAVFGMDSRIGPKFLKAGVGFGGSCFKKDILNLCYLAEANGLMEVANYWKQVIELNEYQERRFVARMVQAMFNSLSGKRIAILGFAFKPGTSDTRESPAIPVCCHLLEEQANLAIHDPEALENARKELANSAGQIDFCEDPYTAATGAHAIALLTDWREYKDLDFERIYESMERPAFIFDGRNCLDHENLYNIGFNVFPLGKVERTRLYNYGKLKNSSRSE
jgi:UDPglucose 6-dehydrogenase